MSILVIQVGQCGNQIGHELFTIYANCAIGNLNSLNSNYLNFSEDIISRFFTESSLTCSERSFTANAILVDTENKVLLVGVYSIIHIYKYLTIYCRL